MIKKNLESGLWEVSVSKRPKGSGPPRSLKRKGIKSEVSDP